MITYIVRRLLWLIPVLFFVAFITFSLMHAGARRPLGSRPERTSRWTRRPRRLLNRAVWFGQTALFEPEGGNPFDSQFFNYILGAVRGDLGPSYRQRGLDVQDILFKPPKDKPFWESRFGYFAAPWPVGVGIGGASWHSVGHYRRAAAQHVARLFALFVSTIGISVPSFVLALLHHYLGHPAQSC